MIELSRTVRFTLAPDGSLAEDAPVANSYAAWPPMRGLGRYYELELTCRGEADEQTGYFLNIKEIDRAVRAHALPRISQAAQAASRTRAATPLGRLMRTIVHSVADPLGRCVIGARFRLTPFYSLTIQEADMAHVLLTHAYEFAAAHRLHSPALSEQENREVYGKCNNPEGHGHNYRVDVTVRCPINEEGEVLAVEELDEAVDAAVIQPLDHKNLDKNVPAFADSPATSSVENISRVIYGMLEQPVRDLGVELDAVRVWETSKTSCVYRKPA